MRYRLAVLGAVVLGIGCGSGDASGLLLGTWGGYGGTVTASRNGMLVSLSCGAEIRIAHPVFVGETGAFRVADSLRGSLSGGERDTIPEKPRVSPIEVEGTLRGDHLDIALGFIAPASDLSTVTAIGSVVVFNGDRGKPAAAVACRA